MLHGAFLPPLWFFFLASLVGLFSTCWFRCFHVACLICPIRVVLIFPLRAAVVLFVFLYLASTAFLLSRGYSSPINLVPLLSSSSSSRPPWWFSSSTSNLSLWCSSSGRFNPWLQPGPNLLASHYIDSFLLLHMLATLLIAVTAVINFVDFAWTA